MAAGKEKREDRLPENESDPVIDPRERNDPLDAPTTPDGDPTRPPNPLSEPDIEIKDPPDTDGTPTEVDTPPEDR